MKHVGTLEFDATEDFPCLLKAPIVEAVVQISAKPDQPISEAKLRQHLIASLPDFPELQPLHQLEMHAEMAKEDTPAKFRNSDGWHGFYLTSPDKLNVFQCLRDGIVFSRLAPYHTWDQFVADCLRLWSVFKDFAKPPEIQRVGVRFINLIPLAERALVRKYLAKPPKFIESLNLPVVGFLSQSLHEVPGHDLQLKVAQTIQPPVPPQVFECGLVIDIDVFSTKPIEADDIALNDCLAKTRWLKNKVFFDLIKPSAIKTFSKRMP